MHIWNKNELVTGTAWTSLSMVITALSQLLMLSILTRFLSKSDFGIVAILTFVFGMIETFTDLGFSSAVMHRKDIRVVEFSSLYWLQFLVFASIYVVFLFFTPFISEFYNIVLLKKLLPLSLFGLILLGIGKLYGTVVQKEMKFKTIAIRNITASCFSLILAIVLAFFDFGVYSLVIATLVQLGIVQIWNFIVGQKSVRLSFCLKLKESKPLILIGLYQTGSQFLDYLSSKIDILIIGKLLGTEALGVYNLAKDLIQKCVSLVNVIGNKVTLPWFSKMQEDTEKMRTNYSLLLTVFSSVNFPICFLLGAFSLPLVTILYGESYNDVAPILTILSLWGMLICVGNPVGNIVTATGRTDLAFYYTIVRLLIVLPLIYFASLYNIKIVAISTLLGEFIVFFISWYFELWKTIKLSLAELVNSFISLFFISALLIILCSSIIIVLKCNFIYSTFVFLISSVLYCLLNVMFNRNQIKLLSKMFKNIVPYER